MDIMNLKERLVNFSTEELKNMKKELQDGITKMIMDNELIIKLAIVEALIDERGEKQ